jgi:hypothetical protein
MGDAKEIIEFKPDEGLNAILYRFLNPQRFNLAIQDFQLRDGKHGSAVLPIPQSTNF